MNLTRGTTSLPTHVRSVLYSLEDQNPVSVTANDVPSVGQAEGCCHPAGFVLPHQAAPR